MLPESPRWLVAHGRVSDAREVLRRLRVYATADDVTAELEGIEAAVNDAADAAEARGPRQKGDSICPQFLRGASKYRTMLGVMVMVASRKRETLPTEILLEDTDGCGSPLLLLTCALLMTSSHSYSFRK